MSFAPRVLLLLPLSEPALLEPFVEACLNDKVRLIAVVGEGARETEDLIDEIIVADGSEPDRSLSITTTAHTEDPLKRLS